MLSGHTPEQVPHWMQLSNCSHPGTLMTSLPKPLTRSASYLIVRCISIIGVFTKFDCRRPSTCAQLTSFRSLQRLSVESVTTFRHIQWDLTPIQPEYLNMPCQTLSIF